MYSKKITFGASILALSIAQVSLAESISGVVFNLHTLERIENVNVLLQGQNEGSSTNSSGKFTFPNLNEGNYSLKFSFVGFLEQETQVSVDSDEFVTVYLEEENPKVDEVIVTDSRAKIGTTPATFSNFSNEEIALKHSVRDLPVLISELPSLDFYSETGTGIGPTYLSLRGFDHKRIAVTVNGVPQNDPEDHNVYWYDIADIASNTQDIQVQRGAGNTSYGHAAIGGSINLETTRVNPNQEFKLETGYGSYDTRKFLLNYSSGLTKEGYSFSGKYSKTYTDGYRDETWGEYTSYFFSGTKITDKFSTTVNIYGGPIKDHLAYEGVPKDSLGTNRKYNPLGGKAQIEEFRQDHYEIINEMEINSNLSLTNTIYYIDGNGYFDYRWPLAWGSSFADFGLDDSQLITANGDTISASEMLVRGFVDNDQIGWIPKFKHKVDDFEFQVGLQFIKSYGDHEQEIRWGNILPIGTGLEPNFPIYHTFEDFVVEKNTFGTFLNANYTEGKFNYFASTELVFKQYDLVEDGFSDLRWKANYLFFNPRIGANYNLNENTFVYSSFARTSREPRRKDIGDGTFASFDESEFDTDGNLIQKDYGKISPKIKEETLWDFELGAGFRNEITSFNANVYLMEFENELIKTGTIGEFGSEELINAEKARHIGIELSGHFVFARDFIASKDNAFLKGNLSLSKNRVIEFSDETDANGNRIYPKDWEENPIPSSPEIISNFGVGYNNSNLDFELNGRFVGKQYLDNSKDEAKTLDKYFVLNSNISFKPTFWDNVKFKLSLNNILNKKYSTGGYIEWDGPRYFTSAERNYYLGIEYKL
ncbi:MAG: TonB-dependent receptor [Calditrichaeota bacterium]|nr:MAG: TonB-dependent receptor [Calditrichota bacterium]